VGVVAQIVSVEQPALPTSIENCDCHVNLTNIIGNLLTEPVQVIEEGGFT